MATVSFYIPHTSAIMSVLPIDTTSIGKDGAVYYHINIKLPLRLLATTKRYSDFVALVTSLCNDLAISPGDFPYELPPKKFISFGGERLVNERKKELSKFLNALIQDRELQNHAYVHEFLGLPLNYKFSGSTPANLDTNELSFPADHRSIDHNTWLQYLRQIKGDIFDIKASSGQASVTGRIRAKENIQKVIRPRLLVLDQSLKTLAAEKQIDPLEVKKRNLILSDLASEIDKLVDSLQSTSSVAKRDLFGSGSTNRLIGGSKKPVETRETLESNNIELLQKQVQVHKTQDQELEQLRKIVNRQKQIGEVIYREVEEQNELLDRFNEDLDATGDKLKAARTGVRKIG